MTNSQDIFTQYALLKAQIKEINAQLDALKPEIIEKIRGYEGESVKVGFGTFFVKSIRRYTKYPQQVQDAMENVKELKKNAEESGEAEFTENDELVFRFSKLDDGTLSKNL